MRKRALSAIGGVAVLLTLGLAGLTSCGLGINEPRFQEDPDSTGTDDNTTLRLEEGSVRLAALRLPAGYAG